MHYLDEGSGPPLLMVHGNPTWSFYWRHLIAGLRDQYRVIAVDHLGCGLSDKPQDYSYNLQRHTSNLTALLEALELNHVTLMAHDWGGAIGLGTVLARRDRFLRLILFNPAAFPPPFFPWRIRVCRIPWLGRIAVQGLNVFARAALRMAVQRHDRMTPCVRAGYLAPYDSWANRTAIYQFVRDIPWSPRHPTYDVLAGLERRLGDLADMPAMFIWGMRDWCFRPACLDRLVKHFPAAETVCLNDAGHYVVEDESDRVLEEVQRFLIRTRLDVQPPAPAAEVPGD